MTELSHHATKHPKKQRIVVGLSGGVDSAVTAHLLKAQGHEVVAIFMKNWEGDDSDEYCSSNIDFVDAASVAEVLGIEIEHVNFASEYKDRVFAEFLREYSAGRTPNPDILCNAEIKFKAFLDHAMRLGAEKIATGHYARVRLNEATAKYELLKGLDNSKDQSYFLHRLNQAQLSKTLFPVGELHKTEVRRIADEIKLPNARKKDSTGICFIGERPFREFLNRYIANKPGAIKDETGAYGRQACRAVLLYAGAAAGTRDRRHQRCARNPVVRSLQGHEIEHAHCSAGPRSPAFAIAQTHRTRCELGRRHFASSRSVRCKDKIPPKRFALRLPEHVVAHGERLCT
jgi:tRNA methyl transferase